MKNVLVKIVGKDELHKLNVNAKSTNDELKIAVSKLEFPELLCKTLNVNDIVMFFNRQNLNLSSEKTDAALKLLLESAAECPFTIVVALKNPERYFGSNGNVITNPIEINSAKKKIHEVLRGADTDDECLHRAGDREVVPKPVQMRFSPKNVNAAIVLHELPNNVYEDDVRKWITGHIGTENNEIFYISVKIGRNGDRMAFVEFTSEKPAIWFQKKNMMLDFGKKKNVVISGYKSSPSFKRN